MMYRLLLLLSLPWLTVGCASSSHRDVDAGRDRERAVACAERWQARGFVFDPNTMTCEQMFERVQAIRNAAYWKQQGYIFDPNTMSAKEMDQKAVALRAMGTHEYPPTEAERAAKPQTPAPRTATLEEKPAIRAQDAEVRRMLQRMNITQVRKRFPHYNDMGDMELARGIHNRYFPDIPFSEFAERFLVR